MLDSSSWRQVPPLVRYSRGDLFVSLAGQGRAQQASKAWPGGVGSAVHLSPRRCTSAQFRRLQSFKALILALQACRSLLGGPVAPPTTLSTSLDVLFKAPGLLAP